MKSGTPPLHLANRIDFQMYFLKAGVGENRGDFVSSGSKDFLLSGLIRDLGLSNATHYLSESSKAF